MNASEQDIETILRNPPKAHVPTGLRERLLADVPQQRSLKCSNNLRPAPAGWLKRWLPLLLPGAIALGSGLVLTMQQLEISNLKSSIHSLAAVAGTAIPSASPEQNATKPDFATPADSNPAAAELTRLRGTAQELRTELSSLEALAVENQNLRKELAKPAPVAGLTQEEEKALQDAKDRADRIKCVNNLKQIGLAVRVWSLDNQDRIAPDFISMSNELSTPKILACPADPGHPAVDGWGSFSAANCSYDYFPNDGKTDQDPQKILTRCPIHGSVGLFDGSVQMSVMKTHPEYVVRGDDGQLYLHIPAPSAPADPAPNKTNP